VRLVPGDHCIVAESPKGLSAVDDSKVLAGVISGRSVWCDSGVGPSRRVFDQR
jgi:hypothetical protein